MNNELRKKKKEKLTNMLNRLTGLSCKNGMILVTTNTSSEMQIIEQMNYGEKRLQTLTGRDYMN